ncbi:MAG: S26 family signal peptidase, partial [Arenimonas sp.]
MKIDFALILSVLALFTGLIWLVDRFVFEKRRLAADADAADPILVEYAKSLFPVIFLVLALRSFIAEPFRIPSGSMMPN